MARRIFSRLPGGRRLFAAAVLAVGGLFFVQPLAWGHVTVTPDTAQPGGSAKVTFKVPNERDGLSTVKLQVVLPADHPISSVSVLPVPSWTVTTQKEKLATPVKDEEREITEAVTSVEWAGGQIAPGQFQEFAISLGPLPKNVGKLTFKALQTYSNGEVVRWIDVEEAGQPEPAHPAPALSLATPAPAVVAAPDTSSPDVLARSLGAGGLVAGLIALGWRVLGYKRARTPEPKPAAKTEKAKVEV
jgi:periplasmic copper chaperone A